MLTTVVPVWCVGLVSVMLPAVVMAFGPKISPSIVRLAGALAVMKRSEAMVIFAPMRLFPALIFICAEDAPLSIVRRSARPPVSV